MDQRWFWDLECGSQISYIVASHMIKETWSFIHFNWFPPTALFFFLSFFFLYETICSFFFLLENLVKPKRHSLLSSPPEKSFITGILLLRERNSFGNIPIEGSEVSPTTSHPKIAVTQGERGCPRSLVVGTV